MIALAIAATLGILFVGYSLYQYIYYWEIPIRNFNNYKEEDDDE